MAAWSLAIQLEASGRPLFQQIIHAITTDIERGRLSTGSKLSSSRALAHQLGVNRGTVIAAYEELAATGWITIEATRGAFVVGVPHDRARSLAPARAQLVGFDLHEALPPVPRVERRPDLLLLLGGVPELRELPSTKLARAYRLALGGSRRLLDYGSPQGVLRLREAVGDLLRRTRGVAASPEAITIVHGSQHGIYLAARTLIRPGDLVAVEEPGYRPAWRALRAAGATLVPFPVDREGLDVAALAADPRTFRAVYTTPDHQHPTTVTLSAARRQQLMALARARRMIVIEDDSDFEYHYEGRPILPLASTDPSGNVVYVGTLSKVLAPGVRIGYVVAPPMVSAQIAAYRAIVDTQGDHAHEHAIAILLEDGDLQAHARRMLRRYRARRDVLLAELARSLPALEVAPPSGGTAVWARADGIDTDAWVHRGLAAGVAFQAGRRFTLDDRRDDAVRLGFAACNERELVDAVARLVQALP